ncbi:MAG: hypothetical protein WBQ14_03105 [Gaiellaceae bacterium]
MKALLVGGVIVVLLVPALALAGGGHGLALLIYTLVVAGLALVLLLDRLSRALPGKSFAWPPRMRAQEKEERVAQFEKIERALIAASWNESHLYESMRPLVREIVTARLRRHHRVDLERAPERAYAVVGDGYAWSLIDPERKPPLGRGDRGWSRRELENLLGELEAL